jgi:mono/diheme cytochrome c family protein
MIGRLTLAAVVLALAPGLRARVSAQEIDPSLGKRVAETACSECHRVEAAPTGPSPNPDAPRFADIAVAPSATELSLKVFLRSPHRTMPNVLLKPDEIDSMVSYILSLRRG